jgi:hypothetical protein
MSSQINNAIGLVNQLAAQAVNRAPGNKLHKALTSEDPDDQSPLAILKARKMLNSPLDESAIPGIVAAIGAEIDAFNDAVVISKPTLEEVQAIVGPADSE